MNTSPSKVRSARALQLVVALFGCSPAFGCDDSPSKLQTDSAVGTLDPRDAGDAGGAAASCGNEVVETGEACDPPSAGACDDNCQLIGASVSICGDGTLDADEECDDGNTLSLDGCSDACKVEACGNRRVDPGETCDPPGPTCSDSCQTVPAPASSCGNSVLDLGEECDDGNTLSGDGCSSGCLIEHCGNGRLDQLVTLVGQPALETCDPPQTGYCNSNCQLITSCGDGKKTGAEECDDGNTVNGDGCSADCHTERCGNGRLDPNEDCEPPGTAHCDAQCHAVRVECGDGVLQVGEECDDGNVAYGDGCSPTCQIEKCGNGRLEPPFEQCEPPNSLLCGPHCRRPICGDGVLDKAAGEECEDGNQDSGDGCSSTCHIERCGNGVLDLGEQCEPPNTASCDSACRSTDPNAGDASSALGPASGGLFRLANGAFDTSLTGWALDAPAPAVVQFSPADSAGAPRSGSAQLSTYRQSPFQSSSGVASSQPRPADAPVSANLSQCVRTSPGADYMLSVTAFVPGYEATPVPLDIGARFFGSEDCTGDVLDGVRTSYSLAQRDRWSAWTLPPGSSPDAGFEAPEDAASMLIWMEVSEDVSDIPTSVIVDGIDLAKISPVVCGDGIPESPEECEPSVTPGCTTSCTLPVVCGDGIRAPFECATGSCPADCGTGPTVPVCGDGVVTAPEDCEPPGVGACRSNCTLPRTPCGDGRIQAGETCDPPNGVSCDASCQRIACGNGIVEPPEECEPPGTVTCSTHCRLLAARSPTCGDGLLEGSEECDPPHLQTWCSDTCRRRDPNHACGDGIIDRDLGEECEPPGVAGQCNDACRKPRCGDSHVDLGEVCDPPDGKSCGTDCQLLGGALTCEQCLQDSCMANPATQSLFSACFDLEGVASGGPKKGTPLRQLCTEAVECMRATSCDSEVRQVADANGTPTPVGPFPAACYCGKSALTVLGQASMDHLRACRDGNEPATGPCRAAFENAAESALPGSVLAALDARYSDTPLSAAVQLMTSDCGHRQKDAAGVAGGKPDGLCLAGCSVPSECGDGIVEPGELCDPNDPVSGPLCDKTACTILPCGNGVVDQKWPYGPNDPYKEPPGWSETCDVNDPYTKQNCDRLCHLITTCGDGKRNPSVEACDPGGADQDWSDCCMPSTEGYDYQSQLAACDHNGDGKIDRTEQCQKPSICGNGKIEGAEECDDPTHPDLCDSHCKSISPCTACMKENCGNSYDFCFGATIDPGVRAGCSEILACIDRTGCNTDKHYPYCLCGTVNDTAPNEVSHACVFETPSAEDLTGPCRDEFVRNSGCVDRAGNAPTSCVVLSNSKNPAFGTGAAGQFLTCREQFCATQCSTFSTAAPEGE